MFQLDWGLGPGMADWRIGGLFSEFSAFNWGPMGRLQNVLPLVISPVPASKTGSSFEDRFMFGNCRSNIMLIGNSITFSHVQPMPSGFDGVKSGGIYDAVGVVKENCCEIALRRGRVMKIGNWIKQLFVPSNSRFGREAYTGKTPRFFTCVAFGCV